MHCGFSVLTEFALVLGLDVVSLAFAGALARFTLKRPPGSAEARRLVNAATRAAESFIWRQCKYVLAAAGVATLLLLCTHGLFFLKRLPDSGSSLALWSALATLLGATFTAVVAHLATQVGLRATSRTLRAAGVSLNQGATVALRAAAVTAVSTEALGAALVTALLGLFYVLGGGGATVGADQATAVLARAAVVLPGFAVGAIAAALVFGLGGATYHVAARLGGLVAAGLSPTDPRNPSLVATLVGEHVGVGAGRAVDLFAGGALANVTMVLLGVAAFRADAGALGTRAWALVTLPLVVRGVGLLAVAFGILSGRTTEAERAGGALVRGQLTTAAVAAGGFSGAVFWLLGGAYFLPFFGAALIGAAAGVGVGHAARHRVDRRAAPVREMLESTRSGSAVTAARGLGIGFGHIAIPVAVATVALGVAFSLGDRSGLPGGALLATATALAAFLSTNAYVLCLGLFGPIVSGAISVAGLDPDASRPDVRRRILLLDDAGFESGAVADSFAIVLGGVAATVAGLAVPLYATSGSADAALSLAKSPIAWSGVLGASLVVAFAGSMLDRASRGARNVVGEVDRQLRSFLRDGNVAQVPDGYTPSYRTLIELTSRSSVQGLLVPVLGGLAVPAALAFCLRFACRSSDLAAQALSAFVVVTAATGLALALAGSGASTVLGATHRASRPRDGEPGADAVFGGHALGSFMGSAVAPAASLFIKASAATALIVAPFLYGS
jgi:K(+)-stimulated pyrophosphate-energized sodium pump